MHVLVLVQSTSAMHREKTQHGSTHGSLVPTQSCFVCVKAYSIELASAPLVGKRLQDVTIEVEYPYDVINGTYDRVPC